METRQHEFYKIPFVGDTGVGKTSLIHFHTTGKFVEERIWLYEQGINCPDVKDGVQLQIIDTSEYSIYSLSDAFVIAFDPVNRESFNNIETHLNAVARFLSSPNIPIFIVATKSDLLSNPVATEIEARELSQRLAAQYNRKVYFFGFTSALKNNNVDILFDFVIQKLRVILGKPATQPNLMPPDYASSPEYCLLYFTQIHRYQYENEYFQLFRSTKLKSDGSLTDILHHAAGEENRSRKILITIGWMNLEGKLTAEAPQAVRNAAPSLVAINEDLPLNSVNSISI